MGRTVLLLLLAVWCGLVGCDNDFSPKADFERKLVIFGALDPSLEMQVVRLAWSYDARLGVPPEPLTPTQVSEAAVTLRGGGLTYVFRDTLLTASDGKSIHAWYSRDLIPMPETEYRLEVVVTGQAKITASVTAPTRMYVSAEAIKADTGDGWVRLHSGVTSYKVRPGAYYFRAWVAIGLRENGTVTEYRAEVPTHTSAKVEDWSYPSPQREPELRLDARFLRLLSDSLIGDADSVVSKRLFVRGYVMDANLYSYYKIVRGFDDPVSTRLDKPDISFIDGALGVFGVIIPDSASVSLSRFLK